MGKPLFFIVTPSYNQAQFIKKTIDSVLQQTKVDIQYWVIDGGSNDKTQQILKSYRDKINWISEKDEGQTEAINKGLKIVERYKLKVESAADVSNVFFAYINSDDYYLHPEVFSSVAKQFANHPDKQWLVGDARIVNLEEQDTHKLIQAYKSLLRKLFPSWILFFSNPYPQPAIFIRWQAVEQVGFFNHYLKYVMDYEYWLRVRAKFAEPILFNTAIAAFRVHSNSKGGAQFDKQFKEELLVLKQFTSNPVVIFVHKLHNWLIVKLYRLIK